jgi:hypothetical protein
MDAVKNVPRVFRPLPDDATEEQKRLALVEMANAYATVAHALAFELPAIKEGLELDRAERRLAKVELERFNTELLRQGGIIVEHEETITEHTNTMGHITGRVTALELKAANDVEVKRGAGGGAPSPYDPPPMRAEMPSGLNLERAGQGARELVSQSFQHMASVTPGPNSLVTAKPESLTEIAGNVFDSKIRELQHEQAEKAEMARLHAIEADHLAALAEEARLKQKKILDAEEAAKAAKKRRLDAYSSIAVALVIAALIGAFGLLWGKSLGHESGVADQKAATPVITVPMPVPVPSPSLAAPMPSATATSAPASVAPPHHP